MNTKTRLSKLLFKTWLDLFIGSVFGTIISIIMFALLGFIIPIVYIFLFRTNFPINYNDFCFYYGIFFVFGMIFFGSYHPKENCYIDLHSAYYNNPLTMFYEVNQSLVVGNILIFLCIFARLNILSLFELIFLSLGKINTDFAMWILYNCSKSPLPLKKIAQENYSSTSKRVTFSILKRANMVAIDKHGDCILTYDGDNFLLNKK